MFHSANAAIITKSDLADAAGFDRKQAIANLGRISHHARIFELSARTGDGMGKWLEFLREEWQKVGAKNPAAGASTAPERRTESPNFFQRFFQSTLRFGR